MAENWPVTLAEKTNELHLIHEESWPWPRDLYPRTPLDTRFAPRLRDAIQSKLGQSLNAHAAPLSNVDRRATGARVLVYASYVYEVDYAYEDDRERVYITGIKNRIFTARGKIQPPSLFKKIANLWHKTVDVLVGQTPQVDRQMQKAAGKGQVHIADTKFLIPQVAAQIKAECQLSPNGYLLKVAVPAPNHESLICIPIEFDIDAYGETILCVRHQLGLADRENFPEAMQLNKQLFGRLAVSDADGQGKRYFEYHDRRLYSEMTSEQCAAVLIALVNDLAFLQTHPRFN